MSLPTWAEIESASYPELAVLYWQDIPAKDADQRARVRRMAERMEELNPRVSRQYIPIAPAAPPPRPPPPKPKVKPAPQKADLELFKSLLSR